MSPIFGPDICHLFCIGISNHKFVHQKMTKHQTTADNAPSPRPRWGRHVPNIQCQFSSNTPFQVPSSAFLNFVPIYTNYHFFMISSILLQILCEMKNQPFPVQFFSISFCAAGDSIMIWSSCKDMWQGEEVDAGESFQESQRHFLGNALTQTSHFILFTSSVFLNRLYMAVDHIRWF